MPTSLASNVSVTAAYLKGQYYDEVVADASSYQFVYELRDGDRGIGLYRTYGVKTIAGGEAYGLFGTSSAPGADSYVFGQLMNAQVTTGIVQHSADEPAADVIYTLQGVRLSQEPAHGVYIKNGMKYSK